MLNSIDDIFYREIQIYYEHTKQLLPNSPAGNLWIDVQTDRRCHLPWVTNVREVRNQSRVLLSWILTPMTEGAQLWINKGYASQAVH